MDQTLAADKYPLNLTGDLAGTTKQQKTSFLDPCYSNKRGALPGPMGHLGDTDWPSLLTTQSYCNYSDLFGSLLIYMDLDGSGWQHMQP